MNRIEDVGFLQGSLRVSRNRDGDIDKVCINDLCRILRRVPLIADGTALRKCPTMTFLDVTRPRELYVDLAEAIAFIKWIVRSSKILGTTGTELLQAQLHGISKFYGNKPYV